MLNSILDHVYPSIASSDETPPGSVYLFGFNTFYLPGDSLNQAGLSCTASSTQWLVRYENNIVYTPGTMFPILGNGNCQYNRNIIFGSASASGSNLAVDPKLVDPANGDFRLMPGSPAIDAALPVADLTTAYDFTGAPRPAGAAMDIGAYELP